MDKPQILFENESFAVLDKPAGMTMHGAPGIHEPTLADFVRVRWPHTDTVGDDPQNRPGIVHRLDKETSGTVVIAKTQPAYEELKRQFQDHAVVKTYTALVMGTMSDPSGTVARPIAKGRSSTKRTTRARPGQHKREAVTVWKRETVFRDPQTSHALTLITAMPRTGRMHQIRVHCAAIGHPVAGDYLYGGTATRAYRERLGRMFLHAVRLSFKFQGTLFEFETPLAPELTAFLKTLAPQP